MEYAREIVKRINDAVPKLRDDAVFFGLTRLYTDFRIEEKGQTFPAIIENGEGSPIEFDQKAFALYHRIVSMSSSTTNKQGWGNYSNPYLVRTKMAMFVFCDTLKIDFTAEVLALHVIGSFPNQPIKALMRGVRNTGISFNDAILNEQQVFNEEFKNVDNFLKPEHLFVKINYTVESTVSQQCFNTTCK